MLFLLIILIDIGYFPLKIFKNSLQCTIYNIYTTKHVHKPVIFL